MKLLQWSAILAVGCAFVVLAANAPADDKAVDKDKIVGTWKLTKANGKADTESGVVLEFTKDGKLKITTKGGVKGIKGGKLKDFTEEAPYKVEGDKITIATKERGREHKTTATIETLTDNKLVMVNPEGKALEFEKTK